MFMKQLYPDEVTASIYDLDWEMLSKKKGEFVYEKSPLAFHRIHMGSETSATINNGNIRAQEDFEMFLKFWPKWFVAFLMRFYIKGEESNAMEQ